MPTLLATPATHTDFSTTSDLDVIDTLPPLPETLRELFACRGEHVTVPDELLNSVRAYRLSRLADAIERYNQRLEQAPAMAAVG